MTTRNIKQLIGTNIRELRTAKGMSQVELGKRIGELTGKNWVSQTVSGAESGKREFVAIEVVVLCKVLGCTIGDLLSAKRDELIEITDELQVSSDDFAIIAPSSAHALESATDHALAAETLRRLHLARASNALTGQMDDSWKSNNFGGSIGR